MSDDVPHTPPGFKSIRKCYGYGSSGNGPRPSSTMIKNKRLAERVAFLEAAFKKHADHSKWCNFVVSAAHSEGERPKCDCGYQEIIGSIRSHR